MLMLSACVAVPDVSWLPAALTPGRLMSAVPLKDTPPIFLAVSNWVADPALPDILPVNVPLTVRLLKVDVPLFAVTLPVNAPANVAALTVPPK